ncbi:hypothetical protein [Chryseobacterium vrystaatense]|uniref:hypothetical protein n=1 Tax=Chryseobacterium vrystaatense TaxID=307480 RepID=UPI0011147EE5|nr:hypothetical protein [Chryseobacterium vrystaatense]
MSETTDSFNSWIVVDKGNGKLGRMPVDLFYQRIGNIAKPLLPSDPSPTEEGWYRPMLSSEDNKDADPENWGTLYPNAGNMRSKEGYDTLFYLHESGWIKQENKMPVDILSYNPAISYSENQKFYKSNQIYIVKPGQVLNAGEVPENSVGTKLDLISVNADSNGNLFSFESGQYNSAGVRNTGYGKNALKYNENGSDNTAFGLNALANRLNAGSKNTAVGTGSLYDNEGDNNTAIGYDSLSQVKGDDNVGVGIGANNGVINGNKNTAIGAGAGVIGDRSNTVAIGAGAIAQQDGQAVIGNDNFTELKFFGRITTKDHNVYWADYSQYNYFMAGAGRNDYSDFTANVYGNVGIGHKALEEVNDSMMNTAIGHQALQKLKGGADHTAVGAGALQKQTAGVGCTAMGRLAMANSTVGTNNTGLGDTALEFNIDGNSNTSVGYSSGIKAGGSFNTLMGTFAGGHYLARNGPLCKFNNTVAIGAATLQYNEDFHNNTIVGTYSAHAVQGADNATLGYESLRNATAVHRNTAVGTGAGYWLESGSDNVFIGNNSGRDGQVREVTGSTVIGANAYSVRDNEIVIGKSTDTHIRIAGVEFTRERLEALLNLVS